MSRSRRFLSLLLPMLFLLMAFRQAPLVNPPAISVSSGISQADVVKAIKIALIKRGWTIGTTRPGEIDASLHLRDHVADIAIDYDTSAIQIKYVGSSNLKYEVKRGTAYIHKNYLGWIQNLSTDIQADMIQFGG